VRQEPGGAALLARTPSRTQPCLHTEGVNVAEKPLRAFCPPDEERITRLEAEVKDLAVAVWRLRARAWTDAAVFAALAAWAMWKAFRP
jgi:hypothetical protein